MRETIEDCEFENGERITLFRIHSERFTIRASFDKNKIMREKDFVRFRDAEAFYDSFVEGTDIRKYLNEMLQAVNKEGKYQAALI